MSEDNVTLPGIFSEGYGIIPKKLMKMQIGTIEVETPRKIHKVKGSNIKMVLAYMLSYTGAGKNECFPGIKTIAEDLEISKDTVVYAIKAAEKLNLITKQEMFPDQPLKRNNKYILEFMGQKEVVDVRTSRITTSDGSNLGVVTVERNNNIYNNNRSNNNNIIGKQSFKPPSKEEIDDYCKTIDYSLDAHAFIDYYETRGWLVGKTKMKDWRAAVRTWRRNDTRYRQGSTPQKKDKIMSVREQSFKILEEMNGKSKITQ